MSATATLRAWSNTSAAAARGTRHTEYDYDWRNRLVASAPAVDFQFTYGTAGDRPIAGDWNGDGVSDVGAYRPGTAFFYLDTNLNHVLDEPDATFGFGAIGDVPLTGDWDDDGDADIGVYRPSNRGFYLDTNGDRAWNGSPADTFFQYGTAGDTPVTGDWNHDGLTDIGIWRPSDQKFSLDTNGDQSFTGADTPAFVFGQAGDTPVTGDWYNDGAAATDVGVWRSTEGKFYLDSDGDQVLEASDANFAFGAAGDLPIKCWHRARRIAPCRRPLAVAHTPTTTSEISVAASVTAIATCRESHSW